MIPLQEEEGDEKPEPVANAIMNYQRIKSAVSYIQKREFVEKKLKFKIKTHHIKSHESSLPEDQKGGRHSRHFVYFSSLPEGFYPIDKSVTRAKVIFGLHIFERLEDGRLHFQSLT